METFANFVVLSLNIVGLTVLIGGAIAVFTKTKIHHPLQSQVRFMLANIVTVGVLLFHDGSLRLNVHKPALMGELSFDIPALLMILLVFQLAYFLRSGGWHCVKDFLKENDIKLLPNSKCK